MTGVFSALTGWLFFLALVVGGGSVVLRWFVVPRATDLDDALRPRLLLQCAQLGRVAGIVLVVAVCLIFARQLGEFRDPFAPFAEDLDLLLSTPWGRTWIGCLAASLVSAGGFMLAAAGQKPGWWIATAGLLVVAAFPGLTGHAAAEDGSLGVLMLWADFFHVVAAAAWMGGLGAVLKLEHAFRHARTESDPGSLLPSLVPAFSRVAMVSVGALAATGLLASWVHLPHASALWETGYGRLLAAKLALVLLVMGLGAVNWRTLTPRLRTPDGAVSMRRAAAAELAIGTAILLLTALLVRTSPMGH